MTNAPVLFLGASSDIALASAHSFAKQGHAIQLASRNVQRLEKEKIDIELRYSVEVTCLEFDVLATNSHADFIENLPELPEIVVCAIGALGDQSENETDLEAAARVLRTNFEGPALILSELANRFATRGSGAIVGISSVAGERGRASNYIYGSAKSGFTAFLSGLRNRLQSSGVHVMTVLPGFVDTRMTEGMDLPAALTAAPSEVADAISAGLRKKRNVIYSRKIWWAIMMIIRNIPEAIFKKLSL